MASILFDDHSLYSCDFLESLLVEVNHDSLCANFLRRAETELKDQISRLGQWQRVNLAPFARLRQLIRIHRDAPIKHAGVEIALLCISQVAHYISKVESYGPDKSLLSEITITSIGVGGFAAASIASAPDLLSLVPLALQCVSMAFRLGNFMRMSTQLMYDDSQGSQSWSCYAAGVDAGSATKLLEQFFISRKTPAVSHARVTSASQYGVVLSGPPSTLTSILDQSLLEVPLVTLPVYGPYNTSHLHTNVDIDEVLGLDLINSLLRAQVSKWPVVLGNKAYQKTTRFETLVRAVANLCVHGSSDAFLELDPLLNQLVAERNSREVLPLGPLSPLLKDALPNTRENFGHDSAIRTSSIGGRSGSSGRCKLAIVGMSGRFPDAASHEALWDLLYQGLDVHRVVPKDRFNAETHFDPTGKAMNTTHTPYGCWIKEPGLFDPRFFNMSPREALQTDPMQRLAITTAYEALEMSGYVPNRTPSTQLDRIGTFYGQTSDDWREINAAQEIDTYYITGGVRAFGPGRINYHFGFKGPSFNIDTACSSSAAALQIACNTLWAKDCDTAVVGGLSVLVNPDIFSGLSRGQFLSKTGPCATWDDAADGYCRADGCATVIVKRLDDAIADKDNVLGVVLGTATNHSADAISITHPHGPTQSELSSAILDDAGVDPLDVDYVELHGTGTQAGDGTEITSVTDVFAPRHRKRPTDRPLYIGAVKANIGHGEAASGVTALIKALMMLQKNIIPPHIGIKEGSVMNRTFPADLADRNVRIPFSATPLKRGDGKPRTIFVNNFSAAGGNTGLLLEDPPLSNGQNDDPRAHHIITISAKSKAALVRNAENLVKWMSRNPDLPISHVAYTTTARRIQHYWRLSVTASTKSEAASKIQNKLAGPLSPAPKGPSGSAKDPRIIFVFTGQGSHYAGMGYHLYSQYTVFRQNIQAFERLALCHGFQSFLPLITEESPGVCKVDPVVTQLALCCLQMALVRLLASWNITPGAVIGHSLGEYAALYTAGVLSASDVIFLVGKRAELLVDRCTSNTHTMLAVQAPATTVEDVAESRAVDVACINSYHESVLAGPVTAIRDLAKKVSDDGIKCRQLDVPYAFHSSQVDVILDEFEEIASSVQYNAPQMAIVSPLLGGYIEADTVDSHYLRRHARECVDFVGGLAAARDLQNDETKAAWVEIGPHPVCSTFVKSALGKETATLQTLRRNEDVHKTLTEALTALHDSGRVDIDWDEYHADFKHSTRLVDLPAYSFDNKNYWIQYEGDWCLTKNRTTSSISPIPKPAPVRMSTTSVHNVTSEEIENGVAVVESETNLSREDVRKVLTGHLCNGVPLCPSTLYADIAMTLGDYAYKLLHPDSTQDIGLNIANVQVPKTLIFNDKLDKQILHCKITAERSLNRANVAFYSYEGAQRTEHATCVVYYDDVEAWKCEFKRNAYLIQSRIESLIKEEKNGRTSKVGRGLAYKLFGALVDYDARYQGMEEVVLDSSTCEATAKVSFQTSKEDGDFFFNPYWIDSCCHISGFIINATDAVDSREQVYISHGWGSMRFLGKLKSNETYRSYVRMQPLASSKVMVGDVYVFTSDGELVGIAGEVKFQSIPRKVLNVVLPPRGSSSVPSKKPVSKPSSLLPIQTQGVAAAKKMQHLASTSVPGETRGSSSLVESFLAILAKEVGCERDELALGIAFSELGCDSLMALTVSGRMREELDIDFRSQAFLDYPTIGTMTGYLKTLEVSGTTHFADSSLASSSLSDADSCSITSNDTVATSPLTSGSASVQGLALNNDAEALQHLVRTIIAQEIGVEVDEIIAAPDLEAMGVDSLMSLVILGKLREATGLHIPNDLLTTCPSLASLEKALGVVPVPSQSSSRLQDKEATLNTTHGQLYEVINSHPGNTTASIYKPPRPAQITDNFPHRQATSVLIQGSPRKALKNLFMAPDGGGSATSYTTIDQISPEWAVWGLFSPFLKTPHEFDCGVYGIATKFITEIKRRQPQGPYSLAGWSAGGVFAFEILYQLINAGDQVDNLIFIDSPCPVIIEPMPNGLHGWFASIGLLGEPDGSRGSKEKNTKKVPEWLLPHFTASINALSQYTPVLIPADKCPRVTVIWCEDGVCKNPDDPRPEPYPTGHALFLLDNRPEFGPGRWNEFLDVKKMQIRRMPGNHFTMMQGQLAKQLTTFMREALLQH